MKNQLKNLLNRFYSSNSINTSNSLYAPKSKSENRLLYNWVGEKKIGQGQQSRDKTKI